jgi:hypothetical protein
MGKIARSSVHLSLAVSLLAFLSGCGQAAAPGAANPAATSPAREPDGSAEISGGRYDLARDEGRGGHTLKKHVGRTDGQLRDRLAEERNISAASTWNDREAAETTVSEALRHERGRMEAWIRRGYPRANLALHYDAGRVIGRSLRRGDTQTVDCTSSVIVLRADGPATFFVLTTYPEANE